MTRAGIPLKEIATLPPTIDGLVAMISALRDEMAARFNALADEVDALKAASHAE